MHAVQYTHLSLSTSPSVKLTMRPRSFIRVPTEKAKKEISEWKALFIEGQIPDLCCILIPKKKKKKLARPIHAFSLSQAAFRGP